MIAQPDGFEGKLTSSMMAKLAKCSQDTALRDIDDLLSRGILAKNEGEGGAPATRWSSGITPAGDVVFGGTSYADQSEDAFRWTASAGTELLPRPSGANSCRLSASSPTDGSVAAGSCSSPDGTWRAFRWTVSGGTVDLGCPSGYSNALATGMSRDGSVIVGVATATLDGNDPYDVFRWTEASGFSIIVAARLPGSATGAGAMSDDGSVVAGWWPTADGTSRVFRWTASGGVIDLLPLDADTQSQLSNLSGDGATATGVSYVVMTQAAPGRAVIWDADGKAHAISDLLQAAGADLQGTILTKATSPDGHLFWGDAQLPSGESRGWLARLP